MLVLPIKKKWFDMIRSGEKKEEYREIKPYYDTRFERIFGYNSADDRDSIERMYNTLSAREIIFRNGYRNDSPQFTASCRLKIGKGKPEWGAMDGEEYYILEIMEVGQ